MLSLMEVTTNSINERVCQNDPEQSLTRFVAYHANAKNDKYIANPRFWLRDVDFSCVSPWNSGGGTLRAGTAISKRHVIFAKHFPLWAGLRIVFVGKDGGVCPCYIEKTKPLPKTDIMIASLNAELTDNIKPAKILPEDFSKYLGEGIRMPVVTFNQNEEAVLCETYSIATNMTTRWQVCRESEDERKKRYFKTMIMGDSGNPAFLLIADQAILVYCVKTGGVGSGPAIHLYRKEIQSVMDELCPGYKLETFDFASIGR